MEIERLESLHKLMGFRGWIWLILLTAVFLRLYHLTEAPPGLTHDEADHGLSAWQVVNGERPIYFTIGYGREPLYDYATAGLMALLGPTYLAGRLTAVFASLLLIAITYSWVRRAFNHPTALLTAAGLAVSFWPQMTGRQMLRSTLLPTLFVFAVYFFWRGTQRGQGDLRFPFYALQKRSRRETTFTVYPITNYLLAGLFLGLTFYVYLPARVLWLVFPAMLGFWLVLNRPLFKQTWRGTILTLLVAAIVGLPLFYYLYTHPDVEVRVDELSVPLTAVLDGNFKPLWQNTLASLRLFTIEGDHTWRYNIPGRPFLNPVMGIFFYAGLLITLWQSLRHRHTPSFFNLVWLLLGISPVLITGPELATTQAIGAQPMIYLLPAIALAKLGNWRLETRDWATTSYVLRFTFYVLLFTFTAVSTTRNYFTIWANDPAVRVQYETTMMTAMRYLNEQGVGATAVSTITPAPFHSPALAQVTLHNPHITLRWFDARASLIWPHEPHSTIIIPGFTPIAPALADYLDDTAVRQQSLPLRPTDADRPLDIYQITNTDKLLTHFEATPAITVGDDAATLLGYDLQTLVPLPGEMVRLTTLWRVNRPLPDAILFTHLIGDDGTPLAQADRLDAPGYAWQSGDLMVQLHEFVVPETVAAHTYPLIIGFYNPSTKQRLPLSLNGTPLGDHIQLTTLTLTGEQ
ncbi:MAG: glycosyltransferase family 39 protein [Ardenticatenaceae bacterium]|nr:glycosyltransferase family 39 protein [Ardenticatenaceae bacterium]